VHLAYPPLHKKVILCGSKVLKQLNTEWGASANGCLNTLWVIAVGIEVMRVKLF